MDSNSRTHTNFWEVADVLQDGSYSYEPYDRNNDEKLVREASRKVIQDKWWLDEIDHNFTESVDISPLKSYVLWKYWEILDRTEWKIFFTPHDFKLKTSPADLNEAWWVKDLFSWRSHTFSTPDTSVVWKWWDIYWKSGFREIQRAHRTFTFIWCERTQKLESEYQAAAYIQTKAIMLLWKPLPTCIPISVRSITECFDESWNIWDYRRIFKDYSHSSEDMMFTLWKCFEDLWWDAKLLRELSEDQILEEYLRLSGEHGVYNYILEWTNTRVQDIMKYQNPEEAILQFNRHWNKEKILRDFMANIAEYYGFLHGIWVAYEDLSNCHNVDTTIEGFCLDIDWVHYGNELHSPWAAIRAIYCRNICFSFWGILWFSNEQLVTIFIEVFKESYYNTMKIGAQDRWYSLESIQIIFEQFISFGLTEPFNESKEPFSFFLDEDLDS